MANAAATEVPCDDGDTDTFGDVCRANGQCAGVSLEGGDVEKPPEGVSIGYHQCDADDLPDDVRLSCEACDNAKTLFTTTNAREPFTAQLRPLTSDRINNMIEAYRRFFEKYFGDKAIAADVSLFSEKDVSMGGESVGYVRAC